MKNLLLLFSFLIAVQGYAQEGTSENRGTVHIKKKGQISKVHFDDVNYRLIALDRSGNVLDSAVVSFEMSVTIKGIAYKESTVGSSLSYQMQQLLGRCDRTSKIFFDKIKAKDNYGTVIDMPKMQYTFGYSDEDND
ncbi:MAG: hypothetical protein M3R27_03630 [Bacteroidota bacterium]|nr:hypothetical protein [Bacteroidota bacterium]